MGHTQTYVGVSYEWELEDNNILSEVVERLQDYGDIVGMRLFIYPSNREIRIDFEKKKSR